MKKSAKGWPGVVPALEFAQASLASEPGVHLQSLTKSKKTRENIARRAQFVERVEPEDGDRLILRAVLPLEHCPLLNELTRSHFGRKTREGKRVFDLFYAQNRFSRGELLRGRPLVRCVRFSVNDPDDDASWTKVPLDVLVNKEGTHHDAHHMRFLRDDKRGEVEIRPWWEPAPRNVQCVYFDVWEREGNG